MSSQPKRAHGQRLRRWLNNLPKAELHLHLEGAIPLNALWTLIQKYGGDPSVPTEAHLRQRLTYADFPDFIETWIWKNGFLRTYDDFTFIAEKVAHDLFRQNILYAELFFSPSRFTDRGLEPTELAAAIRKGLDKIPGCETWLVADLVRDHGPSQAALTLIEVAAARDHGIVGIGMGGSEHRFPPEPFAEVYAEARRLGFKTSAHAGEASGSDSVRSAVLSLQVDRVGHATRAEEDPALLSLLCEQRTPLELCPLSNVATGVIKSLVDHPVRRYWDRGLLVTINTDDPGMFHNKLVDEYVQLVEIFHFELDEIRSLILNAADSSWRPETMSPTLSELFSNHPGWQLPKEYCL